MRFWCFFIALFEVLSTFRVKKYNDYAGAAPETDHFFCRKKLSENLEFFKPIINHFLVLLRLMRSGGFKYFPMRAFFCYYYAI
jgi:hypothetical protein